MIFYYKPNTYSAQIEGAGFNFRFGYTCFGIAPNNPNNWGKFNINLSFIYHSSQANRWYLFDIIIWRYRLYYKTDGGYKDEWTGLHFHKLKGRRKP